MDNIPAEVKRPRGRPKQNKNLSEVLPIKEVKHDDEGKIEKVKEVKFDDEIKPEKVKAIPKKAKKTSEDLDRRILALIEAALKNETEVNKNLN